MVSVPNKSIMLSVIKLSVVMLSVIKLSVVMLSVIKLSVVMLSVIKLGVVKLSAVAPNRGHIHNPLYSSLLTNGLN
jgi:hypothetical protein